MTPTSDIKKIMRSIPREAIFVFACATLLIAIFEWLPAVKEARSYISPENYNNHKISCQELLEARPWYGRVNQWFWAWIILTPALIFSVSPNSSSRLRGGRVMLAALVCYWLMNAAVHLQWDIRNAPFRAYSYPLGTEREYRIGCDNVGDGFSLVLAWCLGWIPAVVYAWICSCIWVYYHQMFSKKITGSYKGDAVTRILSAGLKVYFGITFLFALVMAAHSAGLINAKPVGWIYYLALRPLLIPFEIFWY